MTPDPSTAPGSSPGRSIRPALFALAIGGFGIGATEFAAMGLLPELAANLLPELHRSDPDAAIGRAAMLVSAYAIGVVVGAPTLAAWLARFPRRPVLIALAGAFALASIATAAAPTFELAVLARFVSGLPHGAYFGIAGLAAADLMGPGMRGRGAASVLLGLAVSNVLGVPLITAIGHATSWRVAVLAIAAIFAVATVAIALTLPRGEHGPGTSIRTELSALRRPGVWIAVAIGSIGFAGFFAVYSTVASLTTEVAGLPATAVPWLLAVVGLGMTAGNLLGGRLADGGAIRTLIGLMPVFSVLLAGTALLAPFPIPLTIGLFLIGTVGSVMVPSVQVRLMDVAGDAHTLAAALNHSALNIGNAIGAAVAGALISSGWGFVSPLWAGALLGLVGFLCAWLSRAVEQRSRR